MSNNFKTPLNQNPDGLNHQPRARSDCERGASGYVQSCTSPPSSNTGGKSPDKPTAFVDWLNCVFKFDLSPFDFEESFTDLFPSRPEKQQYVIDLLFEVFGLPFFEVIPSFKGFNGYKYSIKLGQYGTLAFGGESQRGTVFLQLNGTGCAQVKDWQKVKHWGESCGAKIRRADLAHDDHEGDTVTLERAREWYDGGLFLSKGRPPKARLVDDLGSNDGKTFYVGSRKSGLYTRIYEKGKQLGDKVSKWVRVEAEIHSKDREIPWDVLINPSFYLAALYPCLNFLSKIQDRIKTIKKATTISYKGLVEHARVQYGRLLNVMLEVERGDIGNVIDQLVRPGVPGRLESYQDFGFDNLELAT